MKAKTRKLLITGVALLIFGPALGYVLWFAGMFYSIQTLAPPAQGTPPGMFPDIGHMFSSMLRWMFASFIPLLLGMLAGASGFFLIIYSLITHFCKTKDEG
ncbi:MAG: hypothetical protein ABSH14_11465 [Verrucomicrobiia bacterium]|jgi:hypothetical protein